MRAFLIPLLALLLPACTSGGSLGDPTPDDDDSASNDDDAADDDDSQPDDDDSQPDDDDTIADNPFEGQWGGSLWFTGGRNGDQTICDGWGDLYVEPSGEFWQDGWCETFNGGWIAVDFWGEIRADGQLAGTANTWVERSQQEAEYELGGGPGDSADSLLFYWMGELIRPDGNVRPYEGHGEFWRGDGDPGDPPPPGR